MQSKARAMMGSCNFRSCGYQANPLDTKRTIPAGEACNEYDTRCGPCGTDDDTPPCVLAKAYMPDQEYVAGFCACETWVQGTFFPELVRPYMM